MGLLVAAAVVYWTASITLFFFPELLHRKKVHAFHPVHVSHRGGAGERTENTIEAFKNALVLGTDMLELDVHLTKDKQVVVVHDSNLYRLCEENVRVRELNFDELPALRTNLPVAFSPERPAVKSSEPLRIPLLSDVFELFPNIPINIDIKADCDDLIELTAQLIETYQRAHLTVCGSAIESVNRRIHKRLPNVPQFFAGRGFLRFVAAFYLGLLPFISVDEDFLELPLPWNLRHLAHSRIATVMLWLLDVTCMNRLLFYHARRRGIQILLWVLNDEASVRRGLQLGATGVMTDYPRFLAEQLGRKIDN